MKKIFSFDAETNGLWGKSFCIGAIVEDKGNIDMFLGRCPIIEPINTWVSENVLPKIEYIKTNHYNYYSLLQAFSRFYLNNKHDADIIVHMGCPVETKIVSDMYKFGFIGDWDAPYPLIDISGNLLQACYNPTSVDTYNKQNNIIVPGDPHNPIYDALAALECYKHLRGVKE